MIHALLVALVACGGGNTNTVAKPAPVEQVAKAPPSTNPSQPAQPTCAGTPRRVIVFDIEPMAADAQAEAQAFSRNLTLADPCFDLRVASTSLADAKKANHCGAESPMCMAVLGMNESADVMIYGRAEKRSAGVTITVRSLDIAKRQVIATVNKPLDASTDLGVVARETVIALLIP